MDYRLRDGLEEKDGMLSAADLDLCCVSCGCRVGSDRVESSRAESREEEGRIEFRRSIRDGLSGAFFLHSLKEMTPNCNSQSDVCLLWSLCHTLGTSNVHSEAVGQPYKNSG